MRGGYSQLALIFTAVICLIIGGVGGTLLSKFTNKRNLRDSTDIYLYGNANEAGELFNLTMSYIEPLFDSINFMSANMPNRPKISIERKKRLLSILEFPIFDDLYLSSALGAIRDSDLEGRKAYVQSVSHFRDLIGRMLHMIRRSIDKESDIDVKKAKQELLDLNKLQQIIESE